MGPECGPNGLVQRTRREVEPDVAGAAAIRVDVRLDRDLVGAWFQADRSMAVRGVTVGNVRVVCSRIIAAVLSDGLGLQDLPAAVPQDEGIASAQHVGYGYANRTCRGEGEGRPGRAVFVPVERQPSGIDH